MEYPGSIAVRCSAIGVVLVWLLVSVGGAANPGFKQYEQYLSALGAEGTQSPLWGRAALLTTGVAIAVLIPTLGRWRALLGVCAAGAAAAAAGMATLPMTCPVGARFCVERDAPVGIDQGHTVAVLVFVWAVVSLLLAAARQLIAGAAARPTLWPAPVLALAVTAAGAPALLGVSGLLQRLLLLAAQVLIVCVGAVAAREHQRRLHRAQRDSAMGRVPPRGSPDGTMGRRIAA